MTLHIGEGAHGKFTLPLELVTQTVAILAKRGVDLFRLWVPAVEAAVAAIVCLLFRSSPMAVIGRVRAYVSMLQASLWRQKQ
jgi:hypothetical protein